MTTIKFNVPGKKRKELVESIANWLGEESMYLGAPSFAYHIGNQIIDRNGILSLVGLSDEAVEHLLEHLYEEGFETEDLPEADEPTRVSIQVPGDDFSDDALNNLRAIVAVKYNLIKKALGAETLSIDRVDDRIEFPWFATEPTPEDLRAYMNFITKLCQMAKNQIRVNSKELIVDNEKYAFRCFLLRLGFIGNEYKADRKILLRNFTGSSAFKCVGKEAE